MQFDLLFLWVLWHIIWFSEWYNNACSWNIYYDKAKTFQGILCHWEFVRYILQVSCKWNFDVGEHVGYSCAVLNWMVVGWNVLPLCLLRSQVWYWRKFFGSSTNFSGSLLWTVIRPDFIFGDGKLWLRSGWMFYCSSSVIYISFVSSNNYLCFSSAFYMFCSCVSIIWVSSWVLSIELIWSYVLGINLFHTT